MGAAGSRYLWGPECPSPSPSSLRFLHRGSGAHGFADLHLPLPFSLQLNHLTRGGGAPLSAQSQSRGVSSSRLLKLGLLPWRSPAGRFHITVR